MSLPHMIFFFFNDTATTEIYTLSLHDALPIWPGHHGELHRGPRLAVPVPVPTAAGGACRDRLRRARQALEADRKSTRLNSSHSQISYAVFCLKKKKTNT